MPSEPLIYVIDDRRWICALEATLTAPTKHRKGMLQLRWQELDPQTNQVESLSTVYVFDNPEEAKIVCDFYSHNQIEFCEAAILHNEPLSTLLALAIV